MVQAMASHRRIAGLELLLLSGSCFVLAALLSGTVCASSHDIISSCFRSRRLLHRFLFGGGGEPEERAFVDCAPWREEVIFVS